MATPRSLPANESARRQPSLYESNWQPSLPEAVKRDHNYITYYIYSLIIEKQLYKLIMTSLTVLVPSQCDVIKRYHNIYYRDDDYEDDDDDFLNICIVSS